MKLFNLPWEVLAVVFAIASFNGKPAAGSSVNVALEASFRAPPFLLELVETAALENGTAYFGLLDKVADGRFLDYTTDQEIFEAFLQLLEDDGHLTTPEALSSFQFALSIHAAAPRIEAHYQYYNTSVEPSLMIAQDAACPVWVHFNGKQYCSPTLERAQQDYTGPAHTEDFPFDHVLSLHSELPVSTLYADINSPLFGLFHKTLSSTARAGRTSYRIRYRPPPTPSNTLALSGYGVELALKRTDYIVIDDRADGQSQRVDDVEDKSPTETSLQAEDMTDLKPLSASELLELGLKASVFILASSDPFGTLKEVSQDFPKYSSAISKLNISEDFVFEHRLNRQTFLPAGSNIIWMNGMPIDTRQMNAFALLDQLRHERERIGNLKEAGLSAAEAISVISHPTIALSKAEGEAPRYDYRDDLEGGKVIVWLNDIEKDKRYHDWPTSMTALLQRTFPGQLPSVRRNIHNLVMPLDLSDMKDVELLVETLQAFVKRSIPIRFGVVPIGDTPESVIQARIVYYLLETYGLSSVFMYLNEITKGRKRPIFNQAKYQAVIKDRPTRASRPTLDLPTILEGQELQIRIQETQKYLRRLGIDQSKPLLFVNGVAIPRNDAWLQSMSAKIDVDLRALQRQVIEGSVFDENWQEGYYLQGAATYRNALIIPEDESSIKVLDVGKVVKLQPYVYNQLPKIPANKDALKQFWSHIIIVADLDSDEGLQLVLEGLNFRKQQTEAEILLLHNPPTTASRNFHSASLYEHHIKGLVLTPDNVVSAITQHGQSSSAVNPEEPHQMAEAFWEALQPLAASIGFQPGQQGVVINGRVVGPIPVSMSFTSGDFLQLLEFERSKRIAPANTALAALGLEDRLENPLAAAKVSSLIALSTVSDVPEGIFDSSPVGRINTFDQWTAKYTVISKGDPSTASINIVAAIDPTSEVVQRWIPILKVISELSGLHMKLFLNPRERMQELPVKRFYRHVLDAKPSFSKDGARVDPKAIFEALPKAALLNLGLEVPPAWLVAPKNSVHDLDNIKLSAINDDTDINAVYELEHILIEGHSRDVTTGTAPRGVQLLLGTEKDPHFADTLIMANLGYFQFKANPGFWNFRLQNGRSQQIYHIDSIGSHGYAPQPGDDTTEVALMSFQGKTLFPRLSRKPGQETEDVLEEGPQAGSAMDYVSKATKFGNSILSKVGLSSKAEHADINIFSVASGHLYERMLNIMMVSVMRHTTHTVKFWFIEQFLSPSFKSSVPFLAAHYKFDYEMVTYKWPHWLRAQTEKQREIWGYKILFLDVLFPLSLDKVIFVDADQIVRTDMYDLVIHDLKGAPYGFTPMCDSRTEMEGFRFWKQGYWKSFLRGLPYHISALYVVDLTKFRQIAAGDRLRQQYHQLSADPASLSNLDQDLPNHMQMVLPIHSLPQEWLWCETWCSDESLRQAKTIDLCNNPQTKEPKLDRARRQVPEWTIYDDEIAGVLKKAREKERGKMASGDAKGEDRWESVQEELDRVAGKENKVKDEL